MNTYLQQGLIKLQWGIYYLHKFWISTKHFIQEQFNKNLYTRILFTNVTAFAIVLIVLVMFSNFMVKQVIYSEIQQELLREAKRVNFALLEQTDKGWSLPPDQQTGSQNRGQQDLLKYLADIYDAKITIFDIEGKITAISAEQEMVPGSRIEDKYLKLFKKGSVATLQTIEKDTGQPVFAAVVPMGDNDEALHNGILLETSSSNFDLSLSKMHLYMVSGGMVLLLFIIIISVYLAVCISRPISRLAATAAEICRGSYVPQCKELPLEEINVLGGQLDKLAERQQKIQAESGRMEEERTRLFAEISHELRTPLTSVQGFVEAIRDGIVQDDALRERYLNTIYTQTIHINRLVDDILELSRLESGNITVEKLPVDLNALAHGVAMSMEPVANRANTSIFVDIKSEKAIMLGDADRLEQVIRNLLKNAIRATENGIIRVEVESCQGKVALSIEDNGAGIAPEDLTRIWERFYRIKNQREEHMGEKGSGLGLVIVKKLVQLQNGSIDVTSQLGKGTIFHISFPAFDPKPNETR
ncbi:ATP-binding protein [Sinanaerobacter chloroacetimidivorans]|uniref:ATP-binding protein n=1 Tax=Sinanaerobacter chloroacetimidivorans TaxID=2818044 RepID=UPI001D04BC62|nr:ATP-binding protein [Sinanaerobacter chloroacetimidivorans]